MTGAGASEAQPTKSSAPAGDTDSTSSTTDSSKPAGSAADSTATSIPPPAAVGAASPAHPSSTAAAPRAHDSIFHPLPLTAAAPPIAAPSTFLRRPVPATTPRAIQPPNPLDNEQLEALHAIRSFLKNRTSYDVMPLSYRLIIFDTSLLVKKSLNLMIQNGIVSAPLWDSKTSTFAGLLTASDYINVVQYYWHHQDTSTQVDQFRLDSLREIEKAINVAPLETVSIHPERPLYEACRRIITTRARRIPLVDVDDETQREMVVSVITQYRILKFIAINVKECGLLRKTLKEISHVGTYSNLATATMDTPVMDVIQLLVNKNISCVPIVDSDGTLINVFESVDVITLIKGGQYEDLALNVGEALLKRSDEFPGIYTCTLQDRLNTIFDTIKMSRVHRFVVIDEQKHLKGVLTLGDVLEYILLEGEETDN